MIGPFWTKFYFVLDPNIRWAFHRTIGPLVLLLFRVKTLWEKILTSHNKQQKFELLNTSIHKQDQNNIKLLNIFFSSINLKVPKGSLISPADTQVDLEVGFKLFFFTDSCSPDLAGQESDWCHIGIIEHFEIFKMAAKMVAKYTFSLFCYSSGFKTYFFFALYFDVKTYIWSCLIT